MSVKQQQSQEAALEQSGVEGPLYAARAKIYPQSVQGQFRQIKWAILLVTLGIYYFLPFVRWDRGPDEPSQAVLVDLAHRRFYFFFIEIWPQEFYYITGLLIIAAFALFLMNAVAGRIWCGYLCPQTVWTDLFMLVERWIEGDRRERMLKAQQPMNLEIFAEKLLKHSTWLLIAWWTGGAWVLYFADAPTLVMQLVTFHGDPIAYAWIAILTFTTYFLAGHMREQVCTYMCPWPRIQAALTDEWALNVTYRYDRGEPRGSLKKVEALRSTGEKAGDCIDCHQCVNVCPTGVDIRDGLQIDCIQCGLCIDACDTIMTRIGRPTGLIGYDTEMNVQRRLKGLASLPAKIIRARTVLYTVLIVAVGGFMLYTLLTRANIGIAALHDRNPLFVRLSDGSIRNGFTMRVTNKANEARDLIVSVEGLEGAMIDSPPLTHDAQGHLIVNVGTDQTTELRVLVTISKLSANGPLSGESDGDHDHATHDNRHADIKFRLTDPVTHFSVTTSDHFFAP
jgi:cytochrome c oxidase accessory protein FixG